MPDTIAEDHEPGKPLGLPLNDGLAVFDESLCLECRADGLCTAGPQCVCYEAADRHSPKCLKGLLEDDEGARFPCTCGAGG